MSPGGQKAFHLCGEQGGSWIELERPRAGGSGEKRQNSQGVKRASSLLTSLLSPESNPAPSVGRREGWNLSFTPEPGPAQRVTPSENVARVPLNVGKHQRLRAGLGCWVLKMWSRQVWGWASLLLCEAISRTLRESSLTPHSPREPLPPSVLLKPGSTCG